VNISRWARAIWRHPSALLLTVQMISVLVYPFMEHRALGRAVFETLAILVLALVMRSITWRPVYIWGAAVVAISAGALSIIDAVEPSSHLVVAGGLLHAGLYFVAGGSLLRYMFSDQRVTLDELFAVGATFTVLAWAFAYTFAGAGTAPRTWFELLFLSVTTLTSTGLSDIVPVTAHARSFVMIEQIAGLGYVALVVSSIVGMTLRRGRGTAGADSDDQ
jgi:hypothetical protein